MSTLEEQFHHAMIGVFENAVDHGYIPTRFKEMVDQHGGCKAAKRLLAEPVIQSGLMRLCELNCLGQSMEGLVLQTRFHELFTDEERAEARRRMVELGYVPK